VGMSCFSMLGVLLESTSVVVDMGQVETWGNTLCNETEGSDGDLQVKGNC
jgi:hypothetical protein